MPSTEETTDDMFDEFPIDPNEPTYCLCHQVSFGEMIACDNDDVLQYLCMNGVFLFNFFSVTLNGFIGTVSGWKHYQKVNGFALIVPPLKDNKKRNEISTALSNLTLALYFVDV